MATRKEERRAEIDLSKEVNEIISSLTKETPAARPITKSDHFQTLIHEFITEELGIDPEVHDIFQEQQAHVLVDRNVITGGNLRYQLLDEGYAPKNSLCHPEAVEDPYDEESRP